MSESRRPGRWRRRLRRAGLGVVVVVVGLTVLSVVANALTVPPERLAPLQGEDVRVDGRPVHYRHWPGPGSPVLLVHGFAESSDSWDPMAGLLARTHDVWALDLDGYGYSAYSGHYGLADQTELVAGLVRALRLDRPVLVGHSLGAAVVGSVALAHPDLVGGVIFADGDALPFRSSDAGGPPGWFFHLPWVVSGYRAATTDAVGGRIIRSSCGSRCDGYSPALVEAWMRPLRQRVAQRAIGQMGRGPMLALTPEQVQQIRVPRAVIWGSEDARSGGSMDEAVRLLGNPPTRVLQGAGHLSMTAVPQDFADGVAELVARMPR